MDESKEPGDEEEEVDDEEEDETVVEIGHPSGTEVNCKLVELLHCH